MVQRILRVTIPVLLCLPLIGAASCHDRTVIVEVQGPFASAMSRPLDGETGKPMGVLELVFPDVPSDKSATGRWRCRRVRTYARPDYPYMVAGDLVKDHPWDTMHYRWNAANDALEVTLRPGAGEDWLNLSFDEEAMTTLEGGWSYDTDGGFVEGGSLRIVRSVPPAAEWPRWWRKRVK